MFRIRVDTPNLPVMPQEQNMPVTLWQTVNYKGSALDDFGITFPLLWQAFIKAELTKLGAQLELSGGAGA